MYPGTWNLELGIGNWELGIKVSRCRAFRGGDCWSPTQNRSDTHCFAGGASPFLRNQAIYNSQFPIPNSQSKKP